MKIGIIGYGKYGHLLHELISRFYVFARVVIFDPECVIDNVHFVPLSGMADCDAVIFAVPVKEFESAVTRLTQVKGLRKDSILVNVCSDQVRSGEIMAALAGERPYICAHSPWGPQAYIDVEEVVKRLPAIVLTKHTLAPEQYRLLRFFLETKGFNVSDSTTAEVHDKVLVGQQMYFVHLVARIMDRLGMLQGDCSSSTISFQFLRRAAEMVRFDEGLFYDLWIKIPECQETLDRVFAAIRQLEVSKDDHANGK